MSVYKLRFKACLKICMTSSLMCAWSDLEMKLRERAIVMKFFVPLWSEIGRFADAAIAS